jgi:NADH-quinone oxidoreductase subunit G
MPDLFINGQPVHAERGQTVMQAARAAGFYIPGFCWHPQLSVAGNCRLCVVEVEGEGGAAGWMEIACNMPVTDGMRVLTDSEGVKARRRETLQFVLLNHPVDCGICDKAGECLLQDAHYEMNGLPSVSTVPKLRASKYHDLSSRVVLDNERCVLCSRCVRFTREVSKSHALGIQHRGDHSLVRAAEGRRLEDDAYSECVVDICPVGALLSRSFLHKARVWYLQATPSVCPACSRGCNVDLWHRKPEWRLQALDARENTDIARVTPRDNPRVNGPWMCNTGRDIARLFGRPRARQAMQLGAPVALGDAVVAARTLLLRARRPAALVSTWASNEELEAFAAAFAGRLEVVVKNDRVAAAGEPIADDFLICADKNPNGTRARALFGDAPKLVPADADLVLVWGEGADFASLPRGAKTILMNAWLAPENGFADVFIPVSPQTERAGHYTNVDGVVSAFAPVARKPEGVAHADQVFAQWAFAEVPA